MTTLKKIDILPAEILITHVCIHLSAKDIELLHQVNVEYRATIKDKEHGKILYHRHWALVTKNYGWSTCRYSLKDGKKEGVYRSWWSNGKVCEESTYKYNKLNGLRKQWTRDGLPSDECMFIDDVRNGYWNIWHRNGTRWIQGNQRNDKPHGPFKFWYEDGQPFKEGTYKDGNLDGTLKSWCRNGDLVESTYKDGVEIKIEQIC